MTLQRARFVFKTHMQAAREGKLTAYDREQLRKAQAVLRSHMKRRNPSGRRTGMTIAEAKRIARQLGMTIKKTDAGDYRVGTRDEESAYYTDDLDDAVDTARAMALHSQRYPSKTRQSNPRYTLIYNQVDKILATKKQKHICDAKCKASGHRYFHDFTSKPKMYGLPNGDLLITTRKH